MCSFSENHPRGWVADAFRAGRFYITSPRAEAPDFAKPTSRLAFWRHLPQHGGGAIASATAAWAILLDRSAVIGKCPNSRGLTTTIVSSREARLAINRFLGFRFASPQVIIPARLPREIFAPAMFDEFPES